MGDEQQPRIVHTENINISGTVHGENMNFGHSSNITQGARTINQAAQPAVDLEALKKSLMELYTHLQSAGLPPEAQMEAQMATYQSKKLLEEKEPQGDALAANIKKIGESLQSANVTIEHGSQLAGTVLKVATILAPVVAGGAKVVAAWFGIPLP